MNGFELLAAGEFLAGEFGVAGIIGLGPVRLRFGRGDIGIRAFRVRLRRLDLLDNGGDRGMLGFQPGGGLRAGNAEIVGVDGGENIAPVDIGIVGHSDGGEIARHLGRDDRDVALDIGVVGRLDIAIGGKPEGGVNEPHDSENRAETGEDALSECQFAEGHRGLPYRTARSISLKYKPAPLTFKKKMTERFGQPDNLDSNYGQGSGPWTGHWSGQ